MKYVLIRQCQSRFIIAKKSFLSPLPYFHHTEALCIYFYFSFFGYLRIYSLFLYLPLQFHSTLLCSFSSLFSFIPYAVKIPHSQLISEFMVLSLSKSLLPVNRSIFVASFCNFVPSLIVKYFPPFSSCYLKHLFTL